MTRVPNIFSIPKSDLHLRVSVVGDEGMGAEASRTRPRNGCHGRPAAVAASLAAARTPERHTPAFRPTASPLGGRWAPALQHAVPPFSTAVRATQPLLTVDAGRRVLCHVPAALERLVATFRLAATGGNKELDGAVR